jgi:murein L,D-transpeptidase YafK
VKASVFAFMAAGIAGCSSVSYQTVRTGSVHASTLQQMEDFNMDRAAPILIRIFKEERALEVWKQDRTGKFALLQSYQICKF